MGFSNCLRYILVVLCFCMILPAPSWAKLHRKQKMSSPEDSSAVTLFDEVLRRDSLIKSIGIQGHVSGDSVIVRWAPMGGLTWVEGKKKGYLIKRLTLNNGVTVDSVQCTTTPLFPWTPNALGDYLKEKKDISLEIAIAAQLIMGRSGGDQTEQGNDTVPDPRDAQNRLSVALLAADRNPVAASILGLRLVDRTVQKGLTYVYRATIAGTSEFNGLDTIVVETPEPIPGPDSLYAHGEDHKIILTWRDPAGHAPSGYIVEREDSSGIYKPLNRLPLMILNNGNQKGMAQFTDTNVINNRLYNYRVYGIDAFGERSLESKISAKAQMVYVPPLPRNIRINPGPGLRVLLEWEQLIDIDSIAGIDIFRGQHADSAGYQLTKKLLPSNSTRFIDSSAVLDEPYYKIRIVALSGKSCVSPPLFAVLADTVPPSAPAGLQGTIDSNGVVFLWWHKNPEQGIAGYRVQRANDLAHVFISRTPHIHPDTFFVDTVSLRTLTKSVYYKLIAVSTHDQYSTPSAIIEVKRPDRVPPLPARLGSVRYDSGKVIISWTPGRSQDAATQLILKKGSGDTMVNIVSLKAGDSVWTDTKPDFGVYSSYTVETIDSTGNRIRSAPMGVLISHRQPSLDSLDISAIFVPDSNSISLQWKVNKTCIDPKAWIVYRSTPDVALSFYKKLAGSATSLTDNLFSGAGEYCYALKGVDGNGLETNLGNPVCVTVTIKDTPGTGK